MLRSVLTVLTAFTFLLSTAQKLEPELNVNGRGLWVDGYDPVAYFADNKAVPGKPEYTFTYQGATFRFASQAHLDFFEASPQKYLPEYGGYCAFAIGDDASKVTAGSSGNSKNHVLSIRFNGRALKLPIAQQYLALAPGRYTMTYRARESGVVGHVRDVDRGGHDVGEGGASLGQDGRHIVDGLQCLSFDSCVRRDSVVGPEADGAGDEDEATCDDAVAVAAHRRWNGLRTESLHRDVSWS